MKLEINTTRRTSKTVDMWSHLRMPKITIACRHIQVFLITVGFFCCYGIRVALSIAVIAMTEPNTKNSTIASYNWGDDIQNLVLSSFFWGYVVTQIPGGELAQRFGAQKFFCFAVGICGIVTVLIPTTAQYGGWKAVIFIRILTGAAQGIIPPCMHILLSKWVPVEERGRAGSCAYSGGYLGNVIALLSCGAISESALGWPSCFYIWGSVAMSWSILYFFFGKQSPADHPTISLDERDYIERSLGVKDTLKKFKTPWIAILTSVPFWALLIAQCADGWGFWMLFTKTPTYMANVLGYNIFENGIVSAVPYLIAWLLSFPISFTCDKMIKDGQVTVKAMRKIANSVGLIIPAFTLIGFSFVSREHRIFAVCILNISVGFNVAALSGYLMNHVDLSPNFAGALMGITNAAANIFGIMAPLICGLVVPDVENIYQWRKVFFFSAGIYIFGNLIFVLFGDAIVQPWNEPTTHLKQNDGTYIMPKIVSTSKKDSDNEKVE